MDSLYATYCTSSLCGVDCLELEARTMQILLNKCACTVTGLYKAHQNQDAHVKVQLVICHRVSQTVLSVGHVANTPSEYSISPK